jgi:hypothetical protein
MRGRLLSALLIAGLVVAAAGPASAQRRDPNIDPEDELAPSQMQQQMPGAVAEPTHGKKAAHPAHRAATGDAAAEPAEKKPARPAPFRAVACNGAFAKDSSNIKLAQVFDAHNVTFSEVDAGSGAKTMASVLFPNDSRKRLEVWWSNPASRSGTYLIVINGQSGWTAPGGVRLGLTLAELEKLNHKPFKLKGFKDNVAVVSDWDGGKLLDVAGGCKVAASVRADPKAAEDAVSALAADKEFSSSDEAVRAVKPTVSEILIGY